MFSRSPVTSGAGKAGGGSALGCLVGAGVLVLAGVGMASPALASNTDFVSTWNTRNTSVGSSNKYQVNLPLESTGTYNFAVDWESDGTVDQTITDAADSGTRRSAAGQPSPHGKDLRACPGPPGTDRLPRQPGCWRRRLGPLRGGWPGRRIGEPGREPSWQARRQDRLHRADAAFDALSFDTAAARVYGLIYSAVIAQGREARGARAADLLIASVAAAHGIPLITRNPEDFSGLASIATIVEA